MSQVRPRPAASSPRPAAVALLVLVACTAFGLLALILGQDVNYDLRNYHTYGVDAWLSGRGTHDIVAAQIPQTFHNPLVNLPAYLAIRTLPPAVAGFLLGAIAGLNLVLVYGIARQALQRHSTALGRWLPAVATAVGVTAPIFLSETGTTFGDNFTSLGVLAGVLLLMDPDRRSTTRLLLAGLCLGAVSGLKLTNAVYAIAAVGATLLTGEQRRLPRVLVLTAVGMVLGFAATAGFWMWDLWQRFGNPLFPYYNGLFRSPFAPPLNWRDSRWLPDGLGALLHYPLDWLLAKHPLPSSEKDYRDARWLVVLVVAAAAVLSVLVSIPLRWRSMVHDTSGLPANDRRQQRFILVFVAIAFPLWLFQFGYSRYLLPLDLMSGITLWLLLIRLPFRPRWSLRLGVVLSVLLMASGAKIPDWGRLRWADSWFGIDRAPLTRFGDVLVVLPTGDPIAYVIPSFPATTRFIGIHAVEGAFKTARLVQLMRDALAGGGRPVWALARSEADIERANPLLASFGLAPAPSSPCIPLKTRVESLALCPLLRLASEPPESQ